jgi:hypothetical protein
MTDQQIQAPAVSVAADAAEPVVAAALAHAKDRVVHAIELVERGPFVVAVCQGCGWETFARRSRPLARSEGHDHVLLHSPSHLPD